MSDSPFSPFRCSDRVRWADVDLIGIMRFSAVTRFLEMAEQELLRAAGLPYAFIFEHPEIWMPRRHLAVEYLSPARIDDLLTMVIWVSRLGDSSLTLAMDLQREDGRSVATVTLVIVCVSAGSFGKRPLPGIIRERLAPFLCPDDRTPVSPDPGG